MHALWIQSGDRQESKHTVGWNEWHDTPTSIITVPTLLRENNNWTQSMSTLFRDIWLRSVTSARRKNVYPGLDKTQSICGQ